MGRGVVLVFDLNISDETCSSVCDCMIPVGASKFSTNIANSQNNGAGAKIWEFGFVSIIIIESSCSLMSPSSATEFVSSWSLFGDLGLQNISTKNENKKIGVD